MRPEFQCCLADGKGCPAPVHLSSAREKSSRNTRENAARGCLLNLLQNFLVAKPCQNWCSGIGSNRQKRSRMFRMSLMCPWVKLEGLEGTAKPLHQFAFFIQGAWGAADKEMRRMCVSFPEPVASPKQGQPCRMLMLLAPFSAWSPEPRGPQEQKSFLVASTAVHVAVATHWRTRRFGN